MFCICESRAKQNEFSDNIEKSGVTFLFSFFFYHFLRTILSLYGIDIIMTIKTFGLKERNPSEPFFVCFFFCVSNKWKICRMEKSKFKYTNVKVDFTFTKYAMNWCVKMSWWWWRYDIMLLRGRGPFRFHYEFQWCVNQYAIYRVHPCNLHAFNTRSHWIAL